MPTDSPTQRSRPVDRLRLLCITVLGSGFAPFASGSWGSLVALLLWILLRQLVLFAGASVDAVEVATTAGVLTASVLCVAWGPWAIARFGARSSKEKDPGQFVLDEFAGQWVALLLLPLPGAADAWTLAVVIGVQLFLFRAFDVLKPPPARQLERLPAGWGILLDDLVAGLYANLTGQLFFRYLAVGAALGLQRTTGA